MKTDLHSIIRSLVYASVCLALCMVLPFLTGQIPQVGSALCPMHIPVLLAGFLCGPVWAALVGAATPLLRFVLFGMPPLMPTGLAMVFELAAYGMAAGLLYRLLPKKPVNVYLALLGAMVCGRVVWGLAAKLVYGSLGMNFTWQIFAAGAFLNAIPGIILHIVLIPVLVLALRRAKIIS